MGSTLASGFLKSRKVNRQVNDKAKERRCVSSGFLVQVESELNGHPPVQRIGSRLFMVTLHMAWGKDAFLVRARREPGAGRDHFQAGPPVGSAFQDAKRCDRILIAGEAYLCKNEQKQGNDWGASDRVRTICRASCGFGVRRRPKRWGPKL
jgi:hypothetical protein